MKEKSKGSPNADASPDELTKREVLAAVFFAIRLFKNAGGEIEPRETFRLKPADQAMLDESQNQISAVLATRSVRDAEHLLAALE